MEWIGYDPIGIHCLPLGSSPPRGGVPGRAQRGAAGFHCNAASAINHPEVRTVPKCVACGTELVPPVRVPNTVYPKILYRIGGQDYCRHHIIRAAVAASVIAEVKPGAGPVATVSRGASSEERFRPFQG